MIFHSCVGHVCQAYTIEQAVVISSARAATDKSLKPFSEDDRQRNINFKFRTPKLSSLVA